MRHDPAGFSAGYWRRGCGLGWTSLLVADDDGGGTVSGRGVVDLTLIARLFGSFAAPGPLLGTNVVAAALSRRGSDAQKAQLLPGLLDGSVLATWCGHPTLDRDGAKVSLEADGGAGWVLDGRQARVEAAAQADCLLVAAHAAGGPIQVLVPSDARGLTVRPCEGLDVTRRYGEVHFREVHIPPSARLGDPSTTVGDLDRQLQLANVIQLAEMVGAMEKAFDMTLEWAFNRYSFGRPLASYQELKHRFADMRAWLEAGRAIVASAADHLEDGSARAGEYTSAGKSFLGVYGVELVQDCVQIHGGIGLTFEHDIHLFLRRVVADSLLFGTASDHRRRLTDTLEAGAVGGD